MTNEEAGEKVKEACIARLERISMAAAEIDDRLMACIVWDAALALKEDVRVKQVLNG